MLLRPGNSVKRFLLTLIGVVLCFTLRSVNAAPHLSNPPPLLQDTAIATDGTIPVTSITLGAMENYRQSGTHVFQMIENPLILLIAFDSLQEQGLALNRIALYVEDAELSGRILTDQEMGSFLSSKGKHWQQLYLGHDYRATDLSAFFSDLASSAVGMNAGEAFVLRILIEQHVIQRQNGRYRPVEPHRVLLALARPEADSEHHLSPARWRLVLRHEASHGEYFTNPGYQRYCASFWGQLSEEDRQIFKEELRFLGYDAHNNDLMINEMQAFLWEPFISGFMECRLQKHHMSMAALRERFLNGILSAQPRITAFFDSDFTRRLLPGDVASVFEKKEERGCPL